MMQKLTWVLVLGIALTAACAKQTSSPQVYEGSEGRTVGLAVPANSPLAKVQNGMRKPDVRKILGEPDDENSYATGKGFIPFYFGNDARRTSWYYKGLGRVVFADGNVFGGGGNEVVRIDFDPEEAGSAPR